MPAIYILGGWLALVSLSILYRHWGPLWLAIRYDWWTYKHNIGLCSRHEMQWAQDCLRYRGTVLTGRYRHWCFAWDGLPMDETCENEWPCECYPQFRAPDLAQFEEGVTRDEA